MPKKTCGKQHCQHWLPFKCRIKVINVIEVSHANNVFSLCSLQQLCCLLRSVRPAWCNHQCHHMRLKLPFNRHYFSSTTKSTCKFKAMVVWSFGLGLSQWFTWLFKNWPGTNPRTQGVNPLSEEKAQWSEIGQSWQKIDRENLHPQTLLANSSILVVCVVSSWWLRWLWVNPSLRGSTLGQGSTGGRGVNRESRVSLLLTPKKCIFF